MRFLLTAILCVALAHSASAYNNNTFGNGRAKSRFCFRGELGWQKSYFISAGASFLKNDLDRPKSFAFAAYIAAEANRSFYNDQFLSPYYSPNSYFLGYKGGIEISAFFLLLGAEYKGQTDAKNTFIDMVMPKAGLTYNGFINLTYGRNILISHSNYFNVGDHMVSLSINL